MKNKMLVLLALLPLVGCNGIDRLINGKESNPVETPAATVTPTPTPTPSPIVWGSLVALPSSDVLPTPPVLNSGETLETITGLLPDPDNNNFQINVPTVGYVRRISDGTWRLMRVGAGGWASTPYYAQISGGIKTGKTYGEYDAICFYIVH